MSTQHLFKTVHDLHKHLESISDKNDAAKAMGFFKTGKGEYGEGDMFMGIRVPVLRGLVKRCRELTIDDIMVLLRSKLHEERLLALFLLAERYKNGDLKIREQIYRLYLDNTRHVNNWDLVDSSAHLIVGAHCENRDRNILYELVLSKSLWERRIAVIATLHFIRINQFDDTFALCAQLLHDREDLMHKAAGWMLREAGKRDQAALERFLNAHSKKMPRTMLRYAIERFEEKKRKIYLA